MRHIEPLYSQDTPSKTLGTNRSACLAAQGKAPCLGRVESQCAGTAISLVKKPIEDAVTLKQNDNGIPTDTGGT